MDTEKIIKTYNIGKDSRLVFGGDNKTYYVKSITPDRKSVFVTIDGSTTFKKPLSKIIKVDSKEIVLEMKLNKMKIGDKVNYDGEEHLIVNILNDGGDENIVLVPMSSIDDEAFSVSEDEIEESVNEIKTTNTKMTKEELKEMIRQNVLNELTTDIKEDTDVEFGDPDGELAPLYADFYEGLEEAEEEVEDVERVDVNIEEPATTEPTLSDIEKEIQGHLNQALYAAQEIEDESTTEDKEKLIQQIGNTIKFFTSDFVVKEADEMEEGKKEYYKDAEADDAEHIKALEKDMKDDKKSSMKESLEILKMKKLAGLLKEGEYAKALLREEDLTPLQQYIYDYEIEISGEEFADKELENIKKLNTPKDVYNYYSAYRGWEQDKDFKNDLKNIYRQVSKKFIK